MLWYEIQIAMSKIMYESSSPVRWDVETWTHGFGSTSVRLFLGSGRHSMPLLPNSSLTVEPGLPTRGLRSRALPSASP